MVQVSAEGLNFSQLVRSLAALKSGLRWPCGSWGHKTIISTDLFTQHHEGNSMRFLHPFSSFFFKLKINQLKNCERFGSGNQSGKKFV